MLWNERKLEVLIDSWTCKFILYFLLKPPQFLFNIPVYVPETFPWMIEVLLPPPFIGKCRDHVRIKPLLLFAFSSIADCSLTFIFASRHLGSCQAFYLLYLKETHLALFMHRLLQHLWYLQMWLEAVRIHWLLEPSIWRRLWHFSLVSSHSLQCFFLHLLNS